MRVYSIVHTTSDTGRLTPPDLTDIPGTRLGEKKAGGFEIEYAASQISFEELTRRLKEQKFTINYPELSRLVIDDPAGLDQKLDRLPWKLGSAEVYHPGYARPVEVIEE